MWIAKRNQIYPAMGHGKCITRTKCIDQERENEEGAKSSLITSKFGKQDMCMCLAPVPSLVALMTSSFFRWIGIFDFILFGMKRSLDRRGKGPRLAKFGTTWRTQKGQAKNNCMCHIVTWDKHKIQFLGILFYAFLMVYGGEMPGWEEYNDQNTNNLWLFLHKLLDL